MAFTVAINQKKSEGNQRVHQISCSVDSASGNVVTGLKVVEHVHVTPISMNSAAIIVKRNVGSGATAIPGTVNLNGMTSGDVFYMTCYGR